MATTRALDTATAALEEAKGEKPKLEVVDFPEIIF
jgi:hypothetical protein